MFKKCLSIGGILAGMMLAETILTGCDFNYKYESETDKKRRDALEIINNMGELLNKTSDINTKTQDTLNHAKRMSNLNQGFTYQARKFKEYANEMYDFIYKSNVPSEVRNAALEYAQALSTYGIVCDSAPYYQENVNINRFEYKQFEKRWDEALYEIAQKQGMLIDVVNKTVENQKKILESSK